MCSRVVCMKIIKKNPSRVFEDFLRRIESEAYSEPNSGLHMDLIDKMAPEFARFIPNPQTRLLDVGCGRGYAGLKFKELGYGRVTAITLSHEDFEAASKKGISCYKMDMTFLEFEDKSFDALWVRHALEHSPFPYLTLLEFNRVLATGGFIYVEIPMPDMPAELENWPNHYSILGEKMWTSLFDRSGFNTRVKTRIEATIQSDDGLYDENYFVFILQKTRDEQISSVTPK